MTYYLDTSALGKIYHDERGSEWMRGLYQSADKILVSQLSAVEFTSMCARLARDGILDNATVNFVLEAFDDDMALRFTSIPFTPEVIHEASEILRTLGVSMPVRSLDAIQLAFFRLTFDGSQSFVTSDRHILNVSKLLSIPTIDPAFP